MVVMMQPSGGPRFLGRGYRRPGRISRCPLTADISCVKAEVTVGLGLFHVVRWWLTFPVLSPLMSLIQLMQKMKKKQLEATRSWGNQTGVNSHDQKDTAARL